MAKVFISYASADGMLAWEIHKWLKEAGHEAFLDQDRHDGIALGKDWRPEIRRQLSRTDAMICLVTSHYRASTCCLDEIRIAQFLGNLLLPIQVEPEVAHPLLASIEYTNLTEARERLIEELWGVDARSAECHSADSTTMSSGEVYGVGVVKRFGSRRVPVPPGRGSAAAELVKLLRPATSGPTTIAVTGQTGSGKTTLAYYAGREAQHLFAGGAVYVNMNGHAQGTQIHISAEQIYRQVLLALCDEDWHSISCLDEKSAGTIYDRRMGEWSDQGRSVLLMLDNVSDREKVDDLLLWKYPAHLVMITTWNADFLRGLPGLEILPPLSPLDKYHVATALGGAVRERHPDDEWLSREPTDQAVEQLATLFGGLPEALTLAKGLLDGQPGMRMEELIRRLNASHLNGLTRSAERVFRLSWQCLHEEHGELGKQAAHLLLLLSVNPGPSISTEAVADLAGMTKEDVGELQAMLRRIRLINDDRWGMHDLVRQYVTELAEKDLSVGQRDAAFGRLLSHYQQHATNLVKKAGWFLLRHSRPGSEPDPKPTWAGRTAALSFFETERLNILSCLRRAHRHVAEVPESELRRPLVELTEAIAGYLRNNGPWETAEQAHQIAADIAGELGELRSQAIAYNDLGITRRLRGNRDEANRALRQAHEIFGACSDTRIVLLGQANTLNELGIVANDTGRNTGETQPHEDAIKVLEPAWDMYRLVGDIIGMANSAKNRAVALARLGESGEATGWLERSLARYREIDDVLGEVEVRNQLGLLQLKKDPELAFKAFHRAVSLMADHNICSLLEEARAHEGIGLYHKSKDDDANAMTSLEKAKGIYSDIGAERDRDRVEKELKELPGSC
ncbi:MAG: TIR domain-containing protein [Pseudonocardiaceae bacterium]